MKKIFATIALLATTSTFAAHGPAGCGLGSVLFEGKEGLVFNVLAATFNGTSGNQTFGMSTGTLGCEDAKSAQVSAVSFIENNLTALSTDISRGEGQTLDAYLTLINAPKANKMELKKNYKTIFSGDMAAKDIHTRISTLIQM
ncbi:DUF3015 family protein [Bacteriovorax sp. Seq25_V]|uniref:DUF3015 family protein n=1 Tax=Bacteriovorax sp. Seq25_V TaxID=1201288 RepID=UPI00038A24B0|nr:DUF3015 family protein [Bacteriovorax sp. Seq25_V]EQC47999.1 PF11220 family protein [Bacteriovorax sp. Seq25_V]